MLLGRNWTTSENLDLKLVRLNNLTLNYIMATHFKGTLEQTLALDTWVKLSRAKESVGRKLKPCLGQHGVTSAQFGVLEMLYHLGTLNQTVIARKMLVSGGNVTMLVDNLEKHSWVERRRSQKDRRVIKVHLTTAGKAVIEQVLPIHAGALTEALAVLTSGERETLGMLCKKLGRGQQTDLTRTG